MSPAAALAAQQGHELRETTVGDIRYRRKIHSAGAPSDQLIAMHSGRQRRRGQVAPGQIYTLAFHAFANETAVGPDRIAAAQYDPAWAQTTWDRTLTFFGRTLWKQAV